MRMQKKGQGATEYLLMLAAVLVIVAIAVYYITAAGPSAIITGTAENIGDTLKLTPSNTMVPDNIPAADWEYRIEQSTGAVRVDFTSGPESLSQGVALVLSGASIVDVTAGDIVKIRYKGGDVHTFATVVGS